MVEGRYSGNLCYYRDKLFLNLVKVMCDVIFVNISYFFNIMVSCF